MMQIRCVMTTYETDGSCSDMSMSADGRAARETMRLGDGGEGDGEEVGGVGEGAGGGEAGVGEEGGEVAGVNL